MISDITYGTIVEGPLWSEPVQVLAYQPLPDGGFHIVGTLTNSQTSINEEITTVEADELRRVTTQVDFTGNARHAFLGLEAKRYRYAALYDPTFAISISKVDPLPHQIEAVWQVLKQTRIRFLIADDPGSGKTIMAGLIAKELKLRNQVKRILIVAPGHLITQWTQEMKTRFEENFTHVTRAYVNSHQHENVWHREQQLITSMDFARQDEIRETIANTHFDLIIVDEAHKMAADQYGETKRYKLGKCLSNCTTHLLFLTATPHRGDSENFRLFLDLLEPGFFADPTQVQESIRKKDNPLFIRRVKEDLKDFEGKPLFLPRHVQTKPFRLGAESEREMELYNALSEYIREQYNRFSEDSQKRNNVAFALVILQRRLASSTYALCISLQRRQKRLTELLESVTLQVDTAPTEQQRDEIEDLGEAERWEREQQWEVLSVAENREELEDEIETLKYLERKAQQIIDSEKEIKLQQFKKALDELNGQHSNEKILIFTEYFDTLDYLAQKVKAWGFSVSVIHGKMPHEKRVETQQIFEDETQILIATEAAGEGINLQFCHLMINYDLPWNPNRLEQRMGRIHRYGQKNEVHVINLVASDTREGAVFNRLFEKLDTIRDALGRDRVYDVIGELFPKRNLAQLMLEAAASTRNHAQLLEEIDTTLDAGQLNFFKNFNEDTLVSPYINLPQVNELQQQAREHGLIPEYTREFFRKTFETLNRTLHKRQDGLFKIERVPSQIAKISEDLQFRQMYPALTRGSYPKVTFDKAHASIDPTAEFISFGHPLFEATVRYAEQTYAEALKMGACFEDPDGIYKGVIVFYEGEIRDGAENVTGKRLFAFYLGDGSDTIKKVNPVLIWDFREVEAGPVREPIEIQELEEKFGTQVRIHLEQYKQELTEERERQVNIKRKYGIASLDQLILKLDRELLELGARSEKGEDVRLVTQNKAEQKRHYEEEKERLEETCRQEVTLARKPPTFAGAIRIIPATQVDDTDTQPYNKSEIERIGMESATRHEEKQGHIVEDISAENLGFDLRSKTPDGKVRCIEVKARADRAPVTLTSNEWFRAKQLKDDYFLYVVLNVATQPELYIIRNPANQITDIIQVKEVRYQVPLSEITGSDKLA
ncbi:MAG: helicase-related protein [Candidatus Poribacteria bacterium]|nr:helicase-related protein [Candidatus Poribacteria bacterium]